mmetsp:Transcript_12550/g.31301  ORF Transcript_12550/g.31301 Transcript_12550/m.31301 type:complete len:213 (-) Transcript_12550:79-717(-)
MRANEHHLYLFCGLRKYSMMASVRNIVIPIGAATAIRLRCIPRVKNPKPSCFHNRLVVARTPSSVLNISFRTTSSGLVSAAPATPAATDLAAERPSTCARWPGAPSGEVGGGRRVCTMSLTQMAHAYLGTVLNTLTVLPCQRPLQPRWRHRTTSCESTLGCDELGSCSMIVPRTIGWLTSCTKIDTTTGGSVVASALEVPWARSSSFPVSEP